MIRFPHLSHRILWPLLLLAILATIVGGILAFNQSGNAQNDNSNVVTPDNITISGEIVCLPHKGDGPHTMECAFGLRSDDNTHYGLRGLDQSQLINGQLTVQTRVRVEGYITPPQADERYDIIGTIDVEEIEIISAAS